jgi:hypothetical protein
MVSVQLLARTVLLGVSWVVLPPFSGMPLFSVTLLTVTDGDELAMNLCDAPLDEAGPKV